MNAPVPPSNTADREIVVTREYNAPRELLWEAWTNPEHVAQWWGPRGFSTQIETMDVRVGGTWKHVMRGPDGVLYPNESVFTEVEKPERIVYRHGGRRTGGPEVNHVSTWTFEDLGPQRSRLTIRMVFGTAAERDFIVKEFGAIEGGKQTLGRLDEFLPTVTSKPFRLRREFNAPRDLVWQAWTDPKHLSQWFGPKGIVIAQCTMDLRPGGMFRYCMKTPDGHEMWGRWKIVEVVAPERLVTIVSFSDAAGGITRHPMSATWPLETKAVTTFIAAGDKTVMELEWSTYLSTDYERRTFDAGHEGMQVGWGGTMEQLDAYLASITGR
ncbi:MAG TPA: SRPBCC family protein [Candidatus Didemnitutus sp.]|nr:SRPBCC family protein [Candidatus Didemnitutus sp.]